MTQDKELLLKDLCGRLPYLVKVHCEEDNSVFTIDTIDFYNCVYPEGSTAGYNIEDNGIKPFLYPLSSMTDEQQIKFQQYLIAQSDVDVICSIRGYDWLNAHHFDYRGLIEKSLALDATGLNIY